MTPEFADFVLAALPPPPARVLEVGCGRGDLAKAMSAAGYGVLGIDPEAPEGQLFRRTKLEGLEEPEPFDAAVARYSLHHVDDLSRALDRLVGSMRPPGILVIEEFGWDLVDQSTADWYRQHQETPPPDSLADWRAEHEGLHGYAEMRAALDTRFSERFFEWGPYLYRCLGRDDLEAREREAIAPGQVQAIGFRYVGVCGSTPS